MYIFYISGKHSTTALSILWPRCWVCSGPSELFDSLVEYIISAFFRVFLWCMDITLLTVQLRSSTNTLPDLWESAAWQVDLWTSWHSWRWLLAPPHLKTPGAGLDLPGGCPSVWYSESGEDSSGKLRSDEASEGGMEVGLNRTTCKQGWVSAAPMDWWSHNIQLVPA